ncbi:MAG: response regulator transcription factor [Chloroflexi bacterium]|nr:response regulator transcription factor [Chloroflexota bacterium]
MVGQDVIRVMVVDDQDMVRLSLGVFLQTQEDMQLVAEASSGSEALHLCAVVCPDVVLVDLVMPEMDGATLIRRLRRHHPTTRCIVLTSTVEAPLIQAAQAAGAVDCVYKTASIDTIADAIRSACTN